MWALPAPPTHSLTDTPIQSLWDSLIIPQQINCTSKPFSSWHTKPSPVIQSRHSSIDYLPLQSIFEPTRQDKRYEPFISLLNRLPDPLIHFWTDALSQALWACPVITHQITCPSKPFFEPTHQVLWASTSFLIIFIIHQWLLWHKAIFICFW